MAPQVVSFMNMKGGVGKTTLAVNVAYALARVHSKKILVVDGDPQFNATQYLLEDEAYLEHVNDEKKGTIRDIFVPRRPGKINTVKGLAKPTNRAKMALTDCSVAVYNPGAQSRFLHFARFRSAPVGMTDGRCEGSFLGQSRMMS